MSTIFLALVASAGLNGSVCIVSERNSDDRLLLVADKTTAAEFYSKGLKKVNCPDEMEWSKEAAFNLCAVYAGYSDEMRTAFTELYKVTPNQVCDAGRAALGYSKKHTGE